MKKKIKIKSGVVTLNIVQDKDKFGKLHEGKKKVTAFYQRVTAEESYKRNLSIPTQQAEGEEMAATQGWLIIRHYAEPRHIGGDEWKRPALQELIRDMNEGLVERVVVRDEDRLWRDIGIQQKFLKILRENKVELWVFRGQIDYKSAQGRLVLGITGATAQFEKDITGERVRRVKRLLAMQGKPAGGPPPFGYTSQSRVKLGLKENGLSDDEAYRKACELIPNAKEWFIDKEEADIVRTIFHYYTHPDLKKRLGCRKITAFLNLSGKRRRSGLPWHPDKVLRVINDPAVAGFMTYDEKAYGEKEKSRLPKHKQELFKANHKLIISVELWKRAQQIKEWNIGNNRKTGKTTKRSFPLSSILICKCGSEMVGKSSGEKHHYYVCKKRKHYGPEDKSMGCDGVIIKVGGVEKTIKKYLESLVVRPQFIIDFTRKFNEKQKKKKVKESVLRAREQELKRVGELKLRYEDRYEGAKDRIEENLAWNKIVELEKRSAQLREEIEKMRIIKYAKESKVIEPKKVRKYLQKVYDYLKGDPVKIESLFRAFKIYHNFSVKVISKNQLEPYLEFDNYIIPLGEEEDKSTDDNYFDPAWAHASKRGQDHAGQEASHDYSRYELGGSPGDYSGS